MGACHSRNHFTSHPSAPTSKSCSLASFPNPTVEVTDDRLPEFISTLHLESQRNRLQGISVAYKFSPINQVSPFFFIFFLCHHYLSQPSRCVIQRCGFSIVDICCFVLEYTSSTCYRKVCTQD